MHTYPNIKSEILFPFVSLQQFFILSEVSQILCSISIEYNKKCLLCFSCEVYELSYTKIICETHLDIMLSIVVFFNRYVVKVWK